jgi:hypothetical protein
VGCVIVAGGSNLVTAEVYEEALGRWRGGFLVTFHTTPSYSSWGAR